MEANKAHKAAQPESVTSLLRYIITRLAEIDAKLASPLTARRLHFRYCCKCGVRVTNQNVGGYEGCPALTGRLYCPDCADSEEAWP
jgi:hypothetical protein